MRKIFGRVCVLIAAAVCILDARTAAAGVRDGICLCLEAVIPALLPFLFLSGMLVRIVINRPIGVMKPVGRLLRLPSGAEGIWLASLVGGYPIGAKLVADACRDGSISRRDGERMLGFCNQAGPAFLFGMLGPIIQFQKLIWLIWGLQILSALITGILLPGGANTTCKYTKESKISIQQSLKNTIGTMAVICGWVVLFRVILAFVSGWFLWLFPQTVQILVTGLLELSNGCAALADMDDLYTAVVLAGVILSFGGSCVMMQTVSVCGELGTGYYFPGKVLQGCINCILGIGITALTEPGAEHAISVKWIMAPLAVVIGILIGLHRKKVVAFLRQILYNNVSYSYERG